jgi:hypothetical protein
MYTLEMEYQIIVTGRMRSLFEWMVRCSRISNNRQMFFYYIKVWRLGWPSKTIDISAIVPQFCLYELVYRGLVYRAVVILENPLIIFKLWKTGQRLLSRMSMYLAEVLFSSASVNVPTPLLQIHTQNNTATRAPPLQFAYSPKHCLFHLSTDFRHT